MSVYGDFWDRAMLGRFWDFITERQRIWWRRYMLLQKPPWTENQLLATAHFTNIYRELDPGSMYAVDHILNRDEPEDERFFNLMIYRLIGLESTHEFLGWVRPGEFEPGDFHMALRECREANEKVYTGAYMVCGYGKGDKDWNVAKLLGDIAADWEAYWDSVVNAPDREQAFKAISARYGFGPFLSYQVLVDASVPLPDPLSSWEDVRAGRGSLLGHSNDGWAFCGPGAQRGAGLLLPGVIQFSEDRPTGHGVPKARNMSPYPRGGPSSRDDVVTELAEMSRDELNARAFDWVPGVDGRPVYLSKSNVQNCLCEFYKFARFLDGNLAKKRNFNSVARYKADREARGHGKQLDLEEDIARGD